MLRTSRKEVFFKLQLISTSGTWEVTNQIYENFREKRAEVNSPRSLYMSLWVWVLGSKQKKFLSEMYNHGKSNRLSD